MCVLCILDCSATCSPKGHGGSEATANATYPYPSPDRHGHGLAHPSPASPTTRKKRTRQRKEAKERSRSRPGRETEAYPRAGPAHSPLPLPRYPSPSPLSVLSLPCTRPWCPARNPRPPPLPSSHGHLGGIGLSASGLAPRYMPGQRGLLVFLPARLPCPSTDS